MKTTGAALHHAAARAAGHHHDRRHSRRREPAPLRRAPRERDPPRAGAPRAGRRRSSPRAWRARPGARPCASAPRARARPTCSPAIADAKLDSIPLVAITGQVPRAMIGTDAFQEIDTYGLTVPITKHNYLVRSAAELLEVIPDAFRIATSGPARPRRHRRAEGRADSRPSSSTRCPSRDGPTRRRRSTPARSPAPRRCSNAAERPVLLVGAGVIAADAAGGRCAGSPSAVGIPSPRRSSASGAMPHDHPLFLGMVGMHAARCTNLVLEECDLLVGLGIRFDDRATGKVSEFCPRAQVVHIDIDPSELGKIKQPTRRARGRRRRVRSRRSSRCVAPRSARRRGARAWRRCARRIPLAMPGADDPCSPYGIVRHTARAGRARRDRHQRRRPAPDVGGAGVSRSRRPRQWLTSGGLGTMGFGLPAAIGAALALPGPPRRLLHRRRQPADEHPGAGDRSPRSGADVKVILLNNGHLGLVRQQQELFYGGRYHASRFHAEPDFAAIARGFGIAACDLGDTREPLAALARALGTPGACLVRVPIAREANVYPMVPPGAANRDMIEEASHAA